MSSGGIGSRFPCSKDSVLSDAAGDPFALRRDRDPARKYDVPDSVRWLIRQLLSARLAKASDLSSSTRLAFQRGSVTVSLERDPNQPSHAQTS
jgi:hypothetical protein